jgi:hypothetical protein
MNPRPSQIVLAVAGATLALLLFGLPATGFHFAIPAWRVVLAELLAASVLAYAVWAARAHGWRLVAAAFLAMFAIRHFNTMDEAVFYIDLSTAMVVGGMVVAALSSAAAAAVLVWLMGKGRPVAEAGAPSRPARSAAAWLWRLAAGDLAYVILYFAAGLCVIPFTREFYAKFTLPSPGAIVLMQLFRGGIYMGAVLPLARMIPQRRHAALALGLALSLLGGAVPLLPDNPFMPANIRFAHTIEIGVSNFIYGVVLAYLFVPRPSVPRPSRANGNPVLSSPRAMPT